MAYVTPERGYTALYTVPKPPQPTTIEGSNPFVAEKRSWYRTCLGLPAAFAPDSS
uniref:Uncharacterized protein n=1 Tax=Arundo donax TaxID=35708 RepID=A0A0A9FSX8_ARUDO